MAAQTITVAQEDTDTGQIVITATYNDANGVISSVNCTKPADATPTLLLTDNSNGQQLSVDLPAGQTSIAWTPPRSVRITHDSEGHIQLPYNVTFG